MVNVCSQHACQCYTAFASVSSACIISSYYTSKGDGIILTLSSLFSSIFRQEDNHGFLKYVFVQLSINLAISLAIIFITHNALCHIFRQWRDKFLVISYVMTTVDSFFPSPLCFPRGLPVVFLSSWPLSATLDHIARPCPVACQEFCPWNFPGKNIGLSSHSLLQGIFLTQGSNSGLLQCRQILYHLSHQDSPPEGTINLK